MTDADRTRLSFVEEVSYGVNPGTTLQDLRVTGESLAKETETTQSAELTADRQVADSIRNNIRVGGGFNFEFSWGAFDKFLAALLYSADFGAASEILGVDGNNAITIVAATGNISDDAAGGLFSSVVVGQWVELSNFSNALNNVLVKVLSKPDNDNIVVAGLKALADETRAADSGTANAKIVIGSQITNGTTQRSFTFERAYTALTKFSVYRGLIIQSMSLDISADAIITGSFDFLGQNEDVLASSTAGGGNTAAPTNPVMNAIDNVLGIIEGAPTVNTDNEFVATQLSLSVNNNLRERSVIGTLGPASIGAGKINVSGSLQAFFASQAAADKYLNFTSTGISFIIRDSDGNRYVFDIPRVKFSQGTKVAGGENTDIVLDLNFDAFKHETEGKTIRIAKFPL